MLRTPELTLLTPVLDHLELGAEDRARVVHSDPSGVPAALAEAHEDAWCLVRLSGSLSDEALARARDALWPRLHVTAVYQLGAAGTRVDSLHASGPIGPPAAAEPCTVLACRRVSSVLSPGATAQKFDLNAAGWNGDPLAPGYLHHRWMRRHVARFAPAAGRGARILDFGCGAGWVGIEAALRSGESAPFSGQVVLRAFDPSPAMVRIAGENAAAGGILDFEGRVGFGESPPFPAEGEQPFDLVLSSGVVSFARDFEAWMRGLARAVRPGGTLIVGDLDPASRGMRKRRATRPCLPIRELNARSAGEVRAWLEARGFAHEATAGYQLSTPVPQVMHFSDTRLSGLLARPLLGLNAALADIDRRLRHGLEGWFDSYVMRLRRVE